MLEQARIYAALMRLDRPIGIWLLMWPMLWALWIAADGEPDPRIFLIFMAGTLVTRSAGCIINDIADRGLDPQVRRTRSRPLASGQVGTVEALAVFCGLGFVGVGLAALLNPLTQWLAVGAVLLMVLYPFTKRFLSVPQLVLGIAFGWAVPMAFAAQTGEIPEIAWFLFAITAVWAVIYDTMYAMVDRDDDIVAGIRSTAILFADMDRFVIGCLQGVMLLALLMLGRRVGLGGWYFAGVAATAVFMAYQQYLIRDREPRACFAAFLNNHYVGMALFIGILLDYQFR
jgi:4-hydroxybenzoate polyprenyltransferase